MPGTDVKAGWLKDVIVSVSVANLALLEVWHQLIYRSVNNANFLPNYTWHSYFAAIILLLILSVVFLFALRIWRFADGTLVRFIAASVLVAYISVILNAIRITFSGFPIDLAFRILGNPLNLAMMLFVFIIAAVAAWLFRRKLAASIYIGFMIFFPFALLNVVYSAWDGAHLALGDSEKPYNSSVNYPSKGKTMLIIFDELDYRMSFEKRYPVSI